jgi:hypothetical protein
MRTYWITLPPKTRALAVFIAAFVLALIGFTVDGQDFFDLVISAYIAAFVVYFLARWGYFSFRVPITLPTQEGVIYERFRKNPGRQRQGPTNEAEFIDPADADEELYPDDRVVGIYYNGEAAAYPLAALGVRELSNEDYGDTPLTISWSPVTYSARAYIAKVGGSTFTPGRHTHTIFNSPAMPDSEGNIAIQFTGQFVAGSLVGQRLASVPVITSTWAAWKAAYPDTEVMSTEGGPEVDPFERYYANDKNGLHSLNPTDKSLHGKDVVLGLELGGQARAYSYPGLIDTPLIQENFAGREIMVLQERASATAVAFDREIDGKFLTFKGQNKNPQRRSLESTTSGEGERNEYEPWLIVDEETGSIWRAVSGECIEGEYKGKRLTLLPAMTSFWFAWSRFYPNATLVGAIGETSESNSED